MQKLLRPLFFALMLTLSSAAFAQIDWSQNLCGLQKEFLLKGFENRQSVDQLAARVSEQAAEIILVGENHSEKNNHYYPVLLEKLRAQNPALDCVTLEVMPQNRITVESWQELADAGAAHGIKAYKVDGCDPSSVKAGDWVCLAGRNKTMAAGITKLLETGACHGILHVGGAQHLQPNTMDGETGLTQRLQKNGFRTFSIRLMELESDRFSWDWYDPVSRQPICAEHPGVPRRNFVFWTKDQSLAARIPVYHRNDDFIRSGPWSDFDAALALGCPHTANDQCDLPETPGYLVR